jgi:hypothetical protein
MRQSRWSAATRTVIRPIRWRSRATANCNASTVRRPSTTPNRTSNFLALWKWPSLTGGATRMHSCARSARKRRRAIFQRRLSDLSGPHLEGERGFQLHDRKIRDQGSRTRPFDNTVYVFGPVLLVVALRKRAGVQKARGQISALAAKRRLPRKKNRRLWRAPA